jgi:MFS family permease
MGDGTAALSYVVTPPAERARLRTTYVVEGALSFAANLLFVGVFFYTAHVWRWGLSENFLLAAGQGVVYIVASLASQKLAGVMGGRRLLIGANVALAAVSLVGAVAGGNVLLTVAVMVAYVPLMALNWPVLEAAASANADPHTLSRRIGLYNLVWAGTGALAVAVQGLIMSVDPRGVFVVPLVIHVAIVVMILLTRGYGDEAAAGGAEGHAHVDPEPELLAHRTLALWLSRITLPSTYVVIYSLSALMPLLPVMKRLDTTTQTLVGSVWMIARFLTFIALGATVFWHARPRLLLAAAVLMGAAFVGVALPVSAVASVDLAVMIAAQVVLGAALGLIYTASLYFGMVLSEASTEHAGYHEALIGLGQVLGPGAGALTQWRWPGDLKAGVAAVSVLVGASLVAAFVAAARARRRERGGG